MRSAGAFVPPQSSRAGEITPWESERAVPWHRPCCPRLHGKRGSDHGRPLAEAAGRAVEDLASHQASNQIDHQLGGTATLVKEGV